MLVVTEEEALCAHTLIAPHGVNTHLLASTIVVQTLIHICLDGEIQRERDIKGSEQDKVGHDSVLE